VALAEELTLLWISRSELCLTIAGALERGPLYEGMRFAAACHTKMAIRLAAL
jgi:hypothetical protein